MNMNIKIVETYKEDGKYNFYISRINERISWPPNSMLVYFVCQQNNFNLQKAMKSYKILSEGDNKIKIVSINDLACEIYTTAKDIVD